MLPSSQGDKDWYLSVPHPALHQKYESRVSGGRARCQAVLGSGRGAVTAERDAAAGAQHGHVSQQPRPVVHQHLQHPPLILHAEATCEDCLGQLVLSQFQQIVTEVPCC